MAIKPIKRKTVSDEVLEQIKDNIISGEWAPGTKIPGEMDLAEMFGVSRVSIRQAIHRLVGMGVLTIRRGEGTFVSEVLPKDYFNALLPVLMIEAADLAETLEFRAMIEIESARFAARRATDEDISRMEKALANMKKCQGNYKEFAIEDLNFHTAIALATHNSVVVKVTTILHDMLKDSMEEIVRFRGFQDGLHYHARILDAIKNRDAVAAAELMKEHIVAAIKDVRKKSGL
ncbi:MAG TPA: FadR/GntR family transcriptional regulator [Thermoclostridium sp.]|nr:FadR/GntR family transcriptional regulator [Thermoclostridium sp.]